VSGNQSPPPGSNPDPITDFLTGFPIAMGAIIASYLFVQIWMLIWPFLMALYNHKTLKLNDQISLATRLSRTKTGYVGAFLATKTSMITITIFAVSIVTNVLNYLRSLNGSLDQYFPLEIILMAFIIFNSAFVIYTAIFVLIVCRKIVSEINDEDRKN
jgi:hypothetical protein